MAIHFSSDDIDFKLKNQLKIKKWLERVIINHDCRLGDIAYSFCSDDHILEVNNQFLHHDTYTDIITFDYVEGDMISGDILISIDRVGENAKIFEVPFDRELRRVLVHGVLHLLGFKDKSKKDAALMRKKEDESLTLYDTLYC